MDDQTCVAFLQWALPHLRLRWAGFRKVRRQVCKRIARRMQVLQLQDVAAYRDYLQHHREEWALLDGLCRISISRFFRDPAVFDLLRQEIMPELLRQVRRRGAAQFRIWSAGCGAGEEPYSLCMLYELGLDRPITEHIALDIVATDSDPTQLDRARVACYPYSDIRQVSDEWRRSAFIERGDEYCLKPPLRRYAQFLCQDLRAETPPGAFDLILCRNLAFTYFDDALQRQTLQHLHEMLQPEGMLVIGIHETLPRGYAGFAEMSQRLGVYWKQS